MEKNHTNYPNGYIKNHISTTAIGLLVLVHHVMKTLSNIDENES